jgi:peroxiredoxin
MSSLFIRRWTLFSGLILALAAAWIGFTARLGTETTQGRIPAPRPGFLAPDFTLQTLAGETVRLGDLEGQPVILNLWASWCPPCRSEMPAIQAVYEDYQAEGLQVLALNTTYQDSLRDVQGFVDQLGLTFPILIDPDGAASRPYELNSLPSTYFIRADGMIMDVVVGGPMPEALLRAKALELLEAR